MKKAILLKNYHKLDGNSYDEGSDSEISSFSCIRIRSRKIMDQDQKPSDIVLIW